MRGIGKIYRSGRLEVEALQGVHLDVVAGDFLAIVGPSGSGKSTLMHLLGCLDRPTAGTYRLAGTDVAGLSDDELARVSQPHDRVRVPVVQPAAEDDGARERGHAAAVRGHRPVGDGWSVRGSALARLGLEDRLSHEPSELSGGQQQRVAIARALVTRPAIILADEPTGNLDSASGADVLELLHELNDAGTTIVLITHDSDVAVAAKSSVRVRDGRLVA